MSPGERPTELQRAGISSVVRLRGAVVELRARVRGGQLRSLVDSGSTGNYISDRCLAALNIPVVPEDEHEDLTLADGSVVQAQGLRSIYAAMWGFQMSYHRQGLPKPAAGVNPGDALADSGEPQHRLGSPDSESDETWSNPQLANHPSDYWWSY